jgi:hypothetical protein
VLNRDGRDGTVHPVTVHPRRGWTDTGLRLHRGQTITVLSTGTLWAARMLSMGITPQVGLWLRTGDGAVVSMVGAATVFTADTDGPVHVLGAEPGCLDETGTLDPAVRRLPLTGSFAVVLICWTQRHWRSGLAAAAAADPDLFAPAWMRARHGERTPAGWNHHPRIGTADVFTDHQASGGAEISCVTNGDVAILRHPVDVDLTDDLQLSWSWLVDALPSQLAEDIEPTHDYLSVAVEFDDGRDLTWMWSSHLAPGTVFTCPLEYWRDRETHLVIRSGHDDLGRWTAERRTIATDVRTALPPPYPQRVVAIWLIANSTFQGRLGACRYRALYLHTHDTTVSIGAAPSPPAAATSTQPKVLP